MEQVFHGMQRQDEAGGAAVEPAKVICPQNIWATNLTQFLYFFESP